jgi:two-component system chemotaxis response regulator CheB
MTTGEYQLPARPRVLVIDDSAPSRAAIAGLLEDGACEVVGRAMDGSVALRLLEETDPDVITCDLEMPRMDGFTFLRIIQKTRATPVIVITSNVRPEVAIMALELGARDFVVKPNRPSDMKQLGIQLVARVRALASMRHRQLPTWWSPSEAPLPSVDLVAIGASTGGPRAIRDIIGRLQGPPTLPILIAQHMPPRFTEAFAIRLQKMSGLDIREAAHGEIVKRGQVRVAPGGQHILVDRFDAASGSVQVALAEPATTDRWVPAVDALFTSAAAHLKGRVLGVVLTGMGKDGGEGARELARVGAPVWTESSLTAAIDGMPTAAAHAHGGAVRLPLDGLAAGLVSVLSTGGSS